MDVTPRSSTAVTGVLVVGMGRSGTSVVTRVVNRLGVPLGRADDLLPANDANPAGYWESSALLRFQDDLLARFGGSWYAPPQLPERWDPDGAHTEDAEAARAVFRDVYGDAPVWLWKDPRVASLFPFWASVLRDRIVVVLPFRDPAAVAASLRARDGLDVDYGVALWERYNRLTLRHAARHPAFVLDYDELVADPVRVIEPLRRFLEAQRLPVASASGTAPAALAVEPELRRQRVAAYCSPLRSPAQHSLLRTLHHLRGAHDALPRLALPPETPRTRRLIDERLARPGAIAQPAVGV
jgi:hypothetical protein